MNANEQLWEAIEARSVARVKNALKAGADVNDEDEDGYTALMSAAWHGELDIVKLLVAAGADPNRWAQGDTPLQRAASGGHRDIYEYLREIVREDVRNAVSEVELAKGEKWRAREADTVVEPFIKAATMGQLDQLEDGLAAGVDVNAIGSNGQAALHYAAFYGRMPVVERLLAAGANVDVRNEEGGLGGEGSTPLVLVASSFFAGNRAEVIRRLADAGADISAKDAKGMTALMHAVEDFMGSADSVDALIAAGADLEVADNDGNTALMLAVFRKRDEMAKRLREAGASEAGVENVLLHQAASNGDVAEARKLLAEANVNVNHRLKSTALVTACIDGHAEIVQALIKAGADVNERGLSPLIHAANGGFAEITRLLLAAGADVSAEVEGVGTALDYAWTQRPVRGETGRWDEVIQLLEAAGTPMRTKVKKKTKRR